MVNILGRVKSERRENNDMIASNDIELELLVMRIMSPTKRERGREKERDKVNRCNF